MAPAGNPCNVDVFHQRVMTCRFHSGRVGVPQGNLQAKVNHAITTQTGGVVKVPIFKKDVGMLSHAHTHSWKGHSESV